MTGLVVFVLLAVFSTSFAKYDDQWNDILDGDPPPVTPTQLGLFFRNMMRPPPGPNDLTSVVRDDFKTFWIPAYRDTEKTADGLFSYFDHHQNAHIDAQDLPLMMNEADTDYDGLLQKAEFETYMDSAYIYAELQYTLRPVPVNQNQHQNHHQNYHQNQHQNHHQNYHQNQHQNHHQNYHQNHHHPNMHGGKPFFG